MSEIRLYNTMTRRKEPFSPADPGQVKMYVCGPTVYDRPHIGNARSVVVYDVLYRLLRHIYGEDHVTYVRNITDVDDKINAAATEQGVSIQQLTQEVTAGFHADMDALHVLPPTVEPRATGHIPQIVAMIEMLIANGNAYESEGHVLFDTASAKEGEYRYGTLSGRNTEDLIAGARVEVKGYKKNPGDFVLWKPAGEKDDPSSVFESPWGKGRPGWHIECSAMSTTYLGYDFDLHGGGADLMFPHHENEIAQSVCAHPGSGYARHWVHNGFLTVNGEKMSKSLGNFITMRELLDKGVKGEVIRYALLSTHYRKPLDWTEKLLGDAEKSLGYFYKALVASNQQFPSSWLIKDQQFSNALSDDLNIPLYLSHLHHWAQLCHTAKGNEQEIAGATLCYHGELIGLFQSSPASWFQGDGHEGDAAIDTLIDQRIAAKKAKNWAEADRIRDELTVLGIALEDRPDGTTGWRRV